MQAAIVDRAQAMTRQRYRATAARAPRSSASTRPASTAPPPASAAPTSRSPAVDNADPRFRELFTTWRAARPARAGRRRHPVRHAARTTAVNFTSGFGIRSDPFRGRAAMHAGIDLAGPMGTPIYATADGIVGRSEWNNGGYGNLVEIDHGQGIQTRYGHLSQRIAQAGQRIHRGDLIGLMGSTGRSTGSHLHYEVRIDGRAVNPVPFLQASSTFIALQNRGSPAGRRSAARPAARAKALQSGAS